MSAISEFGPVATPGDTDLDFDVEGVVLTSVVRLGNEWIVSGAGGHGRVNGDEWETLTDFQATFGIWRDESVAEGAAMTERFGRWVSDCEPIRITCAPGRLSRFCDQSGRYVVIPRSPATQREARRSE